MAREARHEDEEAKKPFIKSAATGRSNRTRLFPVIKSLRGVVSSRGVVVADRAPQKQNIRTPYSCLPKVDSAVIFIPQTGSFGGLLARGPSASSLRDDAYQASES
jgi:hypothetical protein